MRFAVAALALACLAVAGLPGGTGEAEPDAGSVGIQLLEAPQSRRDDPRASRYIVDHLPPGTVIHRKILVANKSGDLRHVELYPAAATIEHGRFVFGAERATNELTSWISVEPAVLDLRPGEQGRAEVTISVPPLASEGERYAVVWAATASDPAAAPEPPSNVRQVHRVGIRVYLDVGAGGELPSAFSLGRLTATRDGHGRPAITVDVVNTGARAVDLSGTVTLSDGPAGTRAGPFDVPSGTTLAPQQSGRITVRLPAELPDGPWTAAVHLESGTVSNSATTRVSFSGEVPEAASPLVGLELPVFGAVLGLALLTVAVLVLRARRASRRVYRAVRT
jgi:hypothetical protein